MNKKVAVILLNLGGPSSFENIEQFLFNMFSDQHIIDVPNPARFLLAKIISKLRAKSTRKIYELLGGKSLLLENTIQQALALEERLNRGTSLTMYKVFPCMRYAEPRAIDTLNDVHNFQPDKVVLLPLYPQYSCATTQSSIQDWYSSAHSAGYEFDTDIVWCYHNHKDYISAYSELILREYEKALSVSGMSPRILFSAHGLPISFIEKGDPYQQQIRQTVGLIIKKMDITSLDYAICYQSRVGPVRWLEPSTKSELMRAQHDDTPVVVVPVAFVSENSETLVELDMEYKALLGHEKFFRVPALGTNKTFMECLYSLVTQKLS